MEEPIKANKIMRTLIEVGIPPHLRGFSYIVYAEQLIMQNEMYMVGITKSLYIDIAKAFSTSPCNVEHGIRTAIADGWKVAPAEIKMKIFGNSVNTTKVRPTNAHFIMMLYYYMTLQ